MEDTFEVRNLRPSDLDQMFLGFMDAFDDYPVQFRMTKEQFVRKFVQKLKIDFKLSCGVFDDDRLVGFIFSTVNYYENKLTAYNGGTGVIQAYRGKKITKQLYSFLIPKFKEKGVEQGALEVLASNDRAINTYLSLGFEKSKQFACFKLNQKEPKYPLGGQIVSIKPVIKPDWYVYEKFHSYSPSFLDSPLMINQNLSNESVIEANLQGKCVGYAIYQPALGRIGHIAVDESVRRSKIGSSLIQYIFETSKNKNLTMINVNDEAQETINFFDSLGFERYIDQYEMTLKL